MIFRYYTNAISSATKGIAKGIFVVGLLLIGFAALVLAVPEIFAALVAGIFVIAGVGCLVTAMKIFWRSREFDQRNNENSGEYRENVQIHANEHQDMW